MSFRTNVRDAYRLVTWRAPSSATGMSALTAFGLFAIAACTYAISEFFIAGASVKSFSPYGINSIITSMALQALIIVAFARIDASTRTLRNLVLLDVASSFIVLAIMVPISSAEVTIKTSFAEGIIFILAWAAGIIWTLGATRQAFKATPGVRRPGLRSFAYLAVSMIAAFALPHWPIFEPANFSRSTANLWEVVPRVIPPSRDTVQENKKLASQAKAAEVAHTLLEARQGPLLNAAINALEPRDPKISNVFIIGIAGSSYQDVFLSETQRSLDILKSHFHSGARVISLINNTKTAKEYPMASIENIGIALRAVGTRMDPKKDVLILTMTSHGSRDGFVLSYNDFVERTLYPQTLKRMLDEAGIKNRILIISSCYSGVFVPALANADTAIITAASATRTSFGCANDRKWTYFGEALFEKGLTNDATIVSGFETAKATIASWEKEQKIPASDPQIAVGERIARRFPKLIGAMTPTSAAVDTGRHTYRE